MASTPSLTGGRLALETEMQIDEYGAKVFEIEYKAHEVASLFIQCIAEVRAKIDELNECLPDKIEANVWLDEVAESANILVNNIQARVDLRRERMEADK
jgi:hypothetical protein